MMQATGDRLLDAWTVKILNVISWLYAESGIVVFQVALDELVAASLRIDTR